jgi:hypothetical protein
MKASKTALVIAILAAGASNVALADDDARICRVEKLSGLYVFSATGSNVIAGVPQPKAIVELIRFNGDGTLTVPAATRSINGVIARSPPGGTGSYTVEPDCTGTLTFNGGPAFDIFPAPSGDDLWMIQTHDPVATAFVLQGNVTRVSR